MLKSDIKPHRGLEQHRISLFLLSDCRTDLMESMDSPGFVLLLFFMVVTSSQAAGTAEPKCKDFTIEGFNRLEGEAFYFLPYNLYNIPYENITWHNNNSEEISNNKEERIHNYEGALFFSDLRIEDSGFYVALHKMASGQCSKYYLKLAVFDKSKADKVVFGGINATTKTAKVPCPDIARETCGTFKGKLSWEKDSKALQNENRPRLWIANANKSHEGVYTCICTWKHNQKEYKTTASRKLLVGPSVFHQELHIFSPVTKEQFADEGSEINLKCSGQCGVNVEHECTARWHIDGNPVSNTVGYRLNTKTEELANVTIATAVLTIERVSAKDFEAEFMCKIVGFTRTANSTLTLKQRESVFPLIIGGLSVFILCVFVAMVIKYFAIDLALFFRKYLPHHEDTRMYDAYVIYQTQDMTKETEAILCEFVSKNLPFVLEEKCGYRLFIHGRDDIPGEDHVELVEDRMKQSRRLMVVLTPGSGSGSRLASPENAVNVGYDWQVGLHHAMVQREMSVILIQLGDTGPQGYSHLPPGLQHLIQKSAPIRWPYGSKGASARNSRFWKKVRYLMPVTPAKTSLVSAVV